MQWDWTPEMSRHSAGSPVRSIIAAMTARASRILAIVVSPVVASASPARASTRHRVAVGEQPDLAARTAA
jgi:hypothetical protein